MHYTAEDENEKGELSPRGEIWIRGAQVFLGYYRLEQMTKETITSDGWLKTGDVGQVLPGSNAFKIIDRKKNIFKLQQGEYIAPDKVENVYLKSRLVAEVFCYGEPTENFVLLVVVPNKDELLRLAKSQGLEGDYEALARDRKVRTLVLKELNTLAKAEGLNSLEQAKNIYFELENFAARQIMTNTSKLIRYIARKYYKDIIEMMYKEGDILTPGQR
jgi:long-chain acyl-CoA synthetase